MSALASAEIPFLHDRPAEDYPKQVEECLWALRRYLPKRNWDRSYRSSARRAVEQARYLGLKSIGPIPLTQPKHCFIERYKKPEMFRQLEIF